MAGVQQQLQMLADVDLLGNLYAAPDDRLAAVIRLWRVLHNHPMRAQLLRTARGRRSSLHVASHALLSELALTGEQMPAGLLLLCAVWACSSGCHQQCVCRNRVSTRSIRGTLGHPLNPPYKPSFDRAGERVCTWLTPAPLKQHKPYFTILFAASCCILFAAMVGQYPTAGMATEGAAACVASGGLVVGPSALVAWITRKVLGVCTPRHCTLIDFVWLWPMRWILSIYCWRVSTCQHHCAVQPRCRSLVVVVVGRGRAVRVC